MFLSVMSWEPTVKSTSRTLYPNVQVSAIRLPERMSRTVQPAPKSGAISIALPASATLTDNHKVLR